MTSIDGRQQRPVFTPPADWPTNFEIAAQALCKAESGCSGCSGSSGCTAGLHWGEQARAVVLALACHKRLISPAIERGEP